MLTGKYDVDHRPEDRLRKEHILFREKNLASTAPIVALLKEIADAHGVSVPQVALNWLLSKEGVVPIPGAKRPAHVESNAGAVGWALSGKELKRLQIAAESVILDPF